MRAVWLVISSGKREEARSLDLSGGRQRAARVAAVLAVTGLLSILHACALPDRVVRLSNSPTPTPSLIFTPTLTQTPSMTPTSTNTPTASPTSTITDTPTETFTPTITSTPTRTVTPTATPNYRGRVMVQSNCRYGPGAAYLYEWGLYPANRVTVLSRNDDGSWVYVDPWTYIDYCWVKTDLLEINGDVMALPTRIPILPASDLYGPVSNVRASRQGEEVWIAWDGIWMTEDDYRGYLLEVWVCRDGELVFLPILSHEWLVIVPDEGGCEGESHGRVYAAEKHGYTRWVAIPWPGWPRWATPPANVE